MESRSGVGQGFEDSVTREDSWPHTEPSSSEQAQQVDLSLSRSETRVGVQCGCPLHWQPELSPPVWLWRGLLALTRSGTLSSCIGTSCRAAEGDGGDVSVSSDTG